MELTHFDAARREIELARDVDEIKAIRDKAEALRAYAKQAGESLDVQNAAAEIKIRAERRAGEILAEEKRGKATGIRLPERSDGPVLYIPSERNDAVETDLFPVEEGVI